MTHSTALNLSGLSHRSHVAPPQGPAHTATPQHDVRARQNDTFVGNVRLAQRLGSVTHSLQVRVAAGVSCVQAALPPLESTLATSVWAAAGYLTPQWQSACSPVLTGLLGAGALYGAAIACTPTNATRLQAGPDTAGAMAAPSRAPQIMAGVRASWASAAQKVRHLHADPGSEDPEALPRLQHIGLAHMQNRLGEAAQTAAHKEQEATLAVPWLHRRLGTAIARMVLPTAAAGAVCFVTASVPLISLFLAGLTFLAVYLFTQEHDPAPPVDRLPQDAALQIKPRRPRLAAAAAAREHAIYSSEWRVLAAITQRADEKATPLVGLLLKIRETRAAVAKDRAQLGTRRTPRDGAVHLGPAGWLASTTAGTLAAVRFVGWQPVSTALSVGLYALGGTLTLFPVTLALSAIVKKWASALDVHQQQLADATTLLDNEDAAWHAIEQQYETLARETGTPLPKVSLWARLKSLRPR